MAYLAYDAFNYEGGFTVPEAKKAWAIDVTGSEALTSPESVLGIQTIRESWKKLTNAATTKFSDGENTILVTNPFQPSIQPTYSHTCKNGATLTNDEILAAIEAIKEKRTNQGLFDAWSNYVLHQPTRSFMGTNPIRKACEASINK